MKLLLKQGNETYIIKDVQSFDVKTNKGMQFQYNPKINLETKPEGFETPKTKSVVSDELTDLPETARNFNDVASAATKIGAGVTAAESAIYANSLRDDGEVKQVAGKSVSDAVEYSSQFIG